MKKRFSHDSDYTKDKNFYKSRAIEILKERIASLESDYEETVKSIKEETKSKFSDYSTEQKMWQAVSLITHQVYKPYSLNDRYYKVEPISRWVRNGEANVSRMERVEGVFEIYKSYSDYTDFNPQQVRITYGFILEEFSKLTSALLYSNINTRKLWMNAIEHHGCISSYEEFLRFFDNEENKELSIDLLKTAGYDYIEFGNEEFNIPIYHYFIKRVPKERRGTHIVNFDYD